MEISNFINKEEFSMIIISELKEIGVKYRKEKKSKIIQDKAQRKQIFCTHLYRLDLTDVILANGRVVQIPKFVADACNRILEQVETEGIFRKAGSTIRQKEIRTSLEAGVPLGKSHHVIDVANVVKFFFRELPEPLIPTSMHETLLRSLLIGENHVKAILLTCLLLPPLTINTLSFFMQFLYTVSLSEYANKMSVENLAIIFTPGLMPFPNINSHRFKNHVKMIMLLIENANAIGTIPNNIACKIQKNSQLLDPGTTDSTIASLKSDVQDDKPVKKKKKRRSGSLTQMFNGFKKMVGSAIGSSEHLDNTHSENNVAVCDPPVTITGDAPEQNLNDYVVIRSILATPSLKANKKRKVEDTVCASSSKKKRDLLALLPSNSGGFLPNTPIIKERKKNRLSLGGSRHIKNISSTAVVTSMERRWSIVGSGWSKNKNKQSAKNKQHFQSNNCIFDVESTEVEEVDGDINKKGNVVLAQSNTPLDERLNLNDVNKSSARHGKSCVECNMCGDDNESLKISKIKYEEIKERVAAIENRISHEFGEIRSTNGSSDNGTGLLSGPELVQTRYERVVGETASLLSPATDHLAQRLSRGLKIRNSIDQRVIRSPSARKIGTMRRRSQEKTRLSRNQTWHLSSTNQDEPSNTTNCNPSQLQLIVDDSVNHMLPNSFYSKGNLRRGKPNTLHTGLLPLSQIQQNNLELESDKYSIDEQWMSGDEFFSDFVSKSPYYKVNTVSTNNRHVDIVKTPVSRKTTMLPPKSLPKKSSSIKTPSSTSIKPSTTSKIPFVNRIAISTPIDEEAGGRASIAQLRTQNAGMVMAKAKLFDGLGNSSSERRLTRTARHSAQMHPKFNRVVSLTPDQTSMESIITTPKTIINITPIAKRIKSTSVNSPTSSKRRQRSAAVKYNQKQMIKSIVTEEKLIKTRNLNERPLNREYETNHSSMINENSNFISSPRTSKNDHLHCRNPNSPIRIKKNHQHVNFRSKISSPIRNRSKRIMQIRNSPKSIVSKGSMPFEL